MVVLRVVVVAVVVVVVVEVVEVVEVVLGSPGFVVALLFVPPTSRK